MTRWRFGAGLPDQVVAGKPDAVNDVNLKGLGHGD